jgi:ABC-type amino acid transport substrate-binding protein
MKKTIRLIALLLSALSLISCSGCGAGGNDKYEVADRLAVQEFCVGFRLNDKSGDAVIAAMKVLQDSGKVAELSKKWFGDDVSLLKGDPNAIDNLGDTPGDRTFLIGYDSERMPFSGTDENGNAEGFDAEFAEAVCEQLGWKAKFIPIDVSKATVELNSGNVDCVWGGLAYDADNKNINQSPVYLKNTIVLASLKDSGILSVHSLTGKTLTVSQNAYFNAVIAANKSLKNRPAYIVRVPDGTEGCFKALNGGSCAAIVTDLVALDYYR